MCWPCVHQRTWRPTALAALWPQGSGAMAQILWHKDTRSSCGILWRLVALRYCACTTRLQSPVGT
eukprot:5945450-Amphidinium_carterae.1